MAASVLWMLVYGSSVATDPDGRKVNAMDVLQ